MKYYSNFEQIHNLLKQYSVIPLCWECHKGNNGVHGKNGRKLDLKLKRWLQRQYFKLGYEEKEVRELMGGKLY